MDVKEFIKRKPKILGNYVAFKWIELKYTGKIHIPNRFWVHRDLEKGKNCVGEVLGVGLKVTELKKGDLIIFPEYGRIGDKDYLNEVEVYFMKDDFIEVKIDSLPSSLF